MTQLGKWGMPALLLFTGCVVAWAAGGARTGAKARQADDPMVSGVPAYVSDFELPAVGPVQLTQENT